MDLPTVVTYFQLLQAAAALALAWRLLHFRLHREMSWMLGVQLWTAASSIGAANISFAQENYSYLYLIAIPPACIMNVLAVRELFALVFNNYPGIRTALRWAMYVAVGVSLSASLILTWYLGYVPARSHTIFYTVMADRAVSFSLALFILCILYFLSKYPLRLPRNFSVSTAFFCVIFLTDTVTLALAMFPKSIDRQAVDIVQTAIVAVSLGIWAYQLQPPNDSNSFTAPGGTRHDETILLEQLQSFNRVLGKAVHR